MNAGVLVVGGGQAGAQVAISLREGGYGDPITIVGEEAEPPYQRPPLSKTYLMGEADRETLHLREEVFYEDRDIAVITGEAVTEVSPDPSGGGRATTSAGRTLPFVHLVLATGAANRTLSLPGFDGRGVHSLRDIDDADALALELDRARSVVVIGGGFIGLEAAAVASSRGARVTVLEATDRLLARVAGPDLSAYVERYHRDRGVDVRLGARVTGLEHRDDGVAVLLAGGEQVPADVVVVGVGAAPRTGLAEQLGTLVRDGVVVDEYARTTVPGVLAVGDCTSGGHTEFVGRMESVQNAIDQGKVAARTILGRLEPYDSVPFFWSDQGDLRLQMAGVSLPGDETVVRRGEDGISILSFREGSFRGITAVNRPRDFMAGRRVLTRRQELDRAGAADPDRPIRDLVIEASTTAAG